MTPKERILAAQGRPLWCEDPKLSGEPIGVAGTAVLEVESGVLLVHFREDRLVSVQSLTRSEAIRYAEQIKAAAR